MTFLGLQMGSWADWFSALGTIAAVTISLSKNAYEKRLNYEITVYVKKPVKVCDKVNTAVVLNYINKNNFPVGIQLYGIEEYSHFYSRKPINTNILKRFPKNKKSLKPNVIDQLPNYYFNAFFNDERFNSVLKKVYLRAFLLDSSGHYTYSRKYSFKIKDIDNDPANISKD